MTESKPFKALSPAPPKEPPPSPEDMRKAEAAQLVAKAAHAAHFGDKAEGAKFAEAYGHAVQIGADGAVKDSWVATWPEQSSSGGSTPWKGPLLADGPEQRIQDLLDANNQLLERARKAEVERDENAKLFRDLCVIVGALARRVS